jgi:hypothetical protein
MTTSRDITAALASALNRRVEVADLFARLDLGAVHLRWPVDATRDFTDPAACELCRAGWCVQSVVVATDKAATIAHGLALH